MKSKRFVVIAHRGASAHRPENTRSAFEHSLALGNNEFETDVRLTRDGVPVLVHDDDLSRYGYPGLRVESVTLREFRELDLGSWFSGPHGRPERGLTLQELLGLFTHRCRLHLEIKGATPGIEEEVYRRVTDAGALERVIFTSFRRAALDRILRLDRRSRVAWLMESIPETATDLPYEYFQLCPRADLVTPRSLRMLETSCAEVRCWGLPPDERDASMRELQRLADLGCDGVTCNWPELAPRAAWSRIPRLKAQSAAERSDRCRLEARLCRADDRPRARIPSEEAHRGE